MTAMVLVLLGDHAGRGLTLVSCNLRNVLHVFSFKIQDSKFDGWVFLCVCWNGV